MADSEFWRKLAAEFQTSPDFRADGHYVIGSGEPWTWQLAGVAAPFIRASFEALACRAASEIVSSNTPDLVTAWLEELRTGGYNFQMTNGPAQEIQPDGTKGVSYLMGSIHGVCQASATLCKKLEADAIQAEFEEKQRDNPKNWSEFRRRVEAFESIKEIMNEPPYRIPEALVRQIIAGIDGTKPEDVPLKRIAFEIAGLGSSTRRRIEVVPSTPESESTPNPTPTVSAETNVSEVVSDSQLDPKALRDRYLAYFPDEKIKIRDLCWAAQQHYREWKRWLAGELKAGSTPDLAFRRTLATGKRPAELWKKPRPNGWE